MLKSLQQDEAFKKDSFSAPATFAEYFYSSSFSEFMLLIEHNGSIERKGSSMVPTSDSTSHHSLRPRCSTYFLRMQQSLRLICFARISESSGFTRLVMLEHNDAPVGDTEVYKSLPSWWSPDLSSSVTASGGEFDHSTADELGRDEELWHDTGPQVNEGLPTDLGAGSTNRWTITLQAISELSETVFDFTPHHTNGLHVSAASVESSNPKEPSESRWNGTSVTTLGSSSGVLQVADSPILVPKRTSSPVMVPKRTLNATLDSPMPSCTSALDSSTLGNSERIST